VLAAVLYLAAVLIQSVAVLSGAIVLAPANHELDFCQPYFLRPGFLARRPEKAEPPPRRRRRRASGKIQPALSSPHISRLRFGAPIFNRLFLTPTRWSPAFAGDVQADALTPLTR